MLEDNTTILKTASTSLSNHLLSEESNQLKDKDQTHSKHNFLKCQSLRMKLNTEMEFQSGSHLKIMTMIQVSLLNILKYDRSIAFILLKISTLNFMRLKIKVEVKIINKN